MIWCTFRKKLLPIVLDVLLGLFIMILISQLTNIGENVMSVTHVSDFVYNFRRVKFNSNYTP